jgi:gamma-glutamylcyclotransferase (GGCT)/AIG2-like uncharacterized protein YtfP
MSASRNLFVYGTLRRDTRNEQFHLLARHAKFIGEATVDGKLYDLGDYPGMLYPAHGAVHGEVYAVAPEHWDAVVKQLDVYEGCTSSDPQPHEYRRELVQATLSNGSTVSAWAYVLNGEPPYRREIRSGDYLLWRTEARA